MKHPNFELFGKIQKDIQKKVKKKDICTKYDISKHFFKKYYEDPRNANYIKDYESKDDGHTRLLKEKKEKEKFEEHEKKEKEQIKEQLLTSLEKTLGNISQSCRKAGIGRRKFYDLISEDQEFKDKCEELKEGVLDFAESKLKQEINDGNITAIIFFLKTKGKRRGYTENDKEKRKDFSNMTPDELIKIIDACNRSSK